MASLLRPSHELTYAAAEIVLQGCMKKAAEIGVPQCIAIVDTGGHLLAFARMDGAKFHAQRSATQKAITAASTRGATGAAPQDFGVNLSLATGGMTTNLKGGLPILRDGQLVGAVGIGSGTGEQDVEVAQAGIAALEKALAAN
ncbi:MAG: heme-binding protein [Verrucomicrobia bacterium]|nr:heme-binding protein [Verrucomicrobiota bacterium]MBV9658408.1 heme-binding protein [Verrucomicrobiota bacterium]